jgi:hypothetical protein
MQQVLRV